MNLYQIIRIIEISSSQSMIKSMYSNQLLSNSSATQMEKMQDEKISFTTALRIQNRKKPKKSN